MAQRALFPRQTRLNALNDQILRVAPEFMPPIPVYFADSDTFRGAECPDWLLGFLQQQILSDEKFFFGVEEPFLLEAWDAARRVFMKGNIFTFFTMRKARRDT